MYQMPHERKMKSTPSIHLIPSRHIKERRKKSMYSLFKTGSIKIGAKIISLKKKNIGDLLAT